MSSSGATPEPYESSDLSQSFSVASRTASRRTTPLDHVRLIDLPHRHDVRGSLGVVEALRQIPFEIRRIYYLYDVTVGAERGAHAHRALQSLMIAAAGRFDVILSDGDKRRRFTLDTPTK